MSFLAPPDLGPEYQPCFDCSGIVGFDALLYLLLPRSWFARHIARKAPRQLGGIQSFVLPDGSTWAVNPFKRLR